ncbi:MAG: hypothetical protein DWQ19_12610 [Crenarchaeota archaeon]|nr:MAG: hypothetical protein DWQ19_12610 [Thermoproteota archaeon]
MANYIEDANLTPDRFVSALSRYRSSTVVYYHIKNQKKLAFTTYKKQISSVANENDLYMIIPAGMSYRPDLVSQNLYGTPDFWWKIMEANNISDIFDFVAGKNIRIPSNIF